MTTKIERSPMAGLEPVLAVVRKACEGFTSLLRELPAENGIPRDVYIRYLSMQFALTNGVQQHFFACAAHPDVSARRALRSFLLDFGVEEEPHFAIARDDLARLGEAPVAAPPDTRFWWTFFDSIVGVRPFVRLGATCVLESISGGAGDHIRALLGNTEFLDRTNTRFVVLHQHEAVPHGEQILAALAAADLQQRHISDLVEGAEIGALLYLRMARWAVRGATE